MARILHSGTAEAREALRDSCCAFGVFDGLHRGHRYLLDATLESTRAQGHASSAVLTFDIDPDELFLPDTHRKILGNDARIALLADSGVDAVVVLPFSSGFAAKEPLSFLDETFGGCVPREVHVGWDIRFGCQAAGTVETLRGWGDRYGMLLFAHPLMAMKGADITSRRIRGLLAQCRIEEANDLLGWPYAFHAFVEEGRGEGASMGFKTANLLIPDMMRPLGDGVYAAYAVIGGARRKAAVSVGVSPTFEQKAAHNCEVHILDFDEDLYGRAISVEFVHFLRPMMAFDTVEELVSTVMGDISWVRDNL